MPADLLVSNYWVILGRYREALVSTLTRLGYRRPRPTVQQIDQVLKGAKTFACHFGVFLAAGLCLLTQASEETTMKKYNDVVLLLKHFKML